MHIYNAGIKSGDRQKVEQAIGWHAGADQTRSHSSQATLKFAFW